MKCPHCGFNAESFPFCPICGVKLQQSAPQTPYRQPAQPVQDPCQQTAEQPQNPYRQPVQQPQNLYQQPVQQPQNLYQQQPSPYQQPPQYSYQPPRQPAARTEPPVYGDPSTVTLPKNSNRTLLIAAIIVGSVLLSGILIAVLSGVFYNKSVFSVNDSRVRPPAWVEQLPAENG